MDPHDQPTSELGTPASSDPQPDATQVFGLAGPSPAPAPDQWSPPGPPTVWPPPPGPVAPPSAWPPAAPAVWPPSAAAPPDPWGRSFPPAPPGAPPGYGGYSGYGGWPPAPPPPRRSSVGTVLGVAVVALLCACALIAVVAVAAPSSDETAQVMGQASGPQADATQPDGVTPTPGPDGRLLPAPVVPAEDPRYSFIQLEDDGDPAAWDPCEPIEYVVNSRLAPPEAMGILDEAIRRISEVTGLVFVDLGATDEPPPGLGERPDSDPARYGDGWSPVLISWTDVMEDPDLDGAAGLALPVPKLARDGELVYVTGYIEMAGDYAQDLIDLGRSDDVLGVMMHELGHLVGLDHVTDSTQVMTDDPNSTPIEWGAGDRFGLAQVGRGECEPDI